MRLAAYRSPQVGSVVLSGSPSPSPGLGLDAREDLGADAPLVNSSSSTACGSRPSTTVARGTPCSTACRQALILGIIPEARVGRISASASGPISPITSSESGQSR